jgi:hypothetical protein
VEIGKFEEGVENFKQIGGIDWKMLMTNSFLGGKEGE